MQRPRYRGSRQRQHVHISLQLLEPFLVLHAESLLLIYHQQTEILELYIFRQQSVRSYHHVDAAVLKAFYYAFLLCCALEPRHHLDLEREFFKAVFHRVVVLVRQKRRRHEHRRLFSVSHAFEKSPGGNFGLAESDVSAQQSVHRRILFHVAFYLIHASELVIGLGIREAVLEFMLPDRILREGIAFFVHPRCRHAYQFLSHIVHGFLRSRLGLLPLAAGKLVQSWRHAISSDVLLEHPQLIHRDVKRVLTCILYFEVILLHPLDDQLLYAHELADTVAFMNYIVAFLHVREALDLRAC